MSGHGHDREILTHYGRLVISECDDGNDGCAHVTVGGERAAVPAGQFPHLIAAFYEASGKPAPVILERPELPPGGWWVMPGHIGTVDFANRRVVVRAHQDGWYLPPRNARELAAYLAAYADLADTEPDPAEVAELASLLGAAAPVLELGGKVPPAELARTVLRWMREREATP